MSPKRTLDSHALLQLAVSDGGWFEIWLTVRVDSIRRAMRAADPAAVDVWIALNNVCRAGRVLSAIPDICTVLNTTPAPAVAADCADLLGSLGLEANRHLRRKARDDLRIFLASRSSPSTRWDDAVVNSIESLVELTEALDQDPEDDMATAVRLLTPNGLAFLREHTLRPALATVQEFVDNS